MSTTTEADFLVVGAGIAGASTGYFLAPHGKVVVLEQEDAPGYHTTGRSAAMYEPAYGNAQVRTLTAASRAFFDAPPKGFAEHPLLAPRGVVIARLSGEEFESDSPESDEALIADLLDVPGAKLLGKEEVLELLPVLREELVLGGVHDTHAEDVDVGELHLGFLKGIRAHGGEVRCGRKVASLQRVGSHWEAKSGDEVYRAPVVVNAAGAWADVVAQLAGAGQIGLVPKRRSAFVFHPPEGLDVHALPMVKDLRMNFYVKPDAGMLLGSPANADPVPPQDVKPPDLDIALAIYRIEAATTLTVGRPARTWAGLRSFVADEGLVGGYAPDAEGFFWVAAQGGYGIQTSPAMGEATAALVLGEQIPAHIAAHHVTAEALSPSRLR
ncbi:MAG: NAD(P)/FAD-dependent oxidoreductase [Segniliparus sp.]|uniref:NAD(P)/FAD-dependent oxidoreductase n=1 Tax=Segniliparus sp. TaxID=2804064 RepID=UPI003F406F88